MLYNQQLSFIIYYTKQYNRNCNYNEINRYYILLKVIVII